jgi:hypothetical protein
MGRQLLLSKEVSPTRVNLLSVSKRKMGAKTMEKEFDFGYHLNANGRPIWAIN